MWRFALECHCGCSVSSYIKKGHTYMICSKANDKVECPQRNLEEADPLPMMSKIIEAVEIQAHAIEQVLTTLKDKHDNEQSYYQTVIQNARAERARLQKRLDVIYEDRMDGRISVVQYDKLAAQYRAEMEALERKIRQAAESDHDTFIVDSEYLLKLFALAPLLFESSKPELKNKLLKILLLNLKISENHLDYKRWSPLDALNECLENRSWLTIRVSNLKQVFVRQMRHEKRP